MLTAAEKERHARSISVWGEAVQQRLKNGKVLVIGAGGVGSAVLLYLAASGVGQIGIADGDTVELSNLQRQIIHNEQSLGENKAISAARTVSALNHEVWVHVLPEYVTAESMADLAAEYDFVIDCADGIAAKQMINDGCLAAGVPFCYCGTFGYRCQIMTCLPHQSACLRCVFGDTAESIGGGTLAPCCGVIGSMAAMEAIKYLTQTGDLLTDRLLVMDLETMHTQTVTVSPHAACRCRG